MEGAWWFGQEGRGDGGWIRKPWLASGVVEKMEMAGVAWRRCAAGWEGVAHGACGSVEGGGCLQVGKKEEEEERIIK